MTEFMVATGAVDIQSMDIEVYDHLIIGKDGFFSFMDSGLL